MIVADEMLPSLGFQRGVEPAEEKVAIGWGPRNRSMNDEDDRVLDGHLRDVSECRMRQSLPCVVAVVSPSFIAVFEFLVRRQVSIEHPQAANRMPQEINSMKDHDDKKGSERKSSSWHLPVIRADLLDGGTTRRLRHGCRSERLRRFVMFRA